MSFAVKAVKKVGGAIFGGGKKEADTPAAVAASPTGPKVTALTGASSVRKRRTPFAGISSIISDKLGG